MINGSGSNLKNRERMTFNGKSGGGGYSGRNNSGGDNGGGGGSGHHNSHLNNSLGSSALNSGSSGSHQQQQQQQQIHQQQQQLAAAMINQQSAMAAAALMAHQNQFAALVQVQNPRSAAAIAAAAAAAHQASAHHQSVAAAAHYYGFPPFPSASDSSMRPYSFQQQQQQLHSPPPPNHSASNAQSSSSTSGGVQHAPYQNSRMPSNTSSASPPMASVGGGGGSGHSPNASNGSNGNGGSGVTNGNGSATPEGKSSLLSDHTDRSGGGAGGDVRGDHHGGGGSMHHHHHHHGGGGGGHRPPAISKTNLYIRGLTPNTTDKDLHALCSPYGNIISTKAILDKETNKCRGYGFVDFEHPNSAELAVKSLISQGVQAQMAKCSEASRQKAFSLSKGGGGGLGSGGLGGGGGNGGGAGGSINEHDPTNLYIANLPLSMTEHDLEAMLTMYGSVVSTRILKDSNGAPRGVGFARMESKEKCDAIINLLNGRMLPGCKDLLLVKFADGGNKKKHYKHNGGGDRGYRNDVDLQMNFDSTNLATNGVPTQLLPSPLGAAAAASAYQRAAAFSAAAASAAGPYQNALQANPWLVAANQVNPPHGAYIMQPQMIPSNMDPNAALQYSPLMHQLTAQMSHLQLGGVSGAGYMPSAAHAYGAQALYPQQLIQSMTLPGEESINPSHSVSSGSASGEDPQQQVQQVQQQQQQQQQQQHSYQQQQMAYASQLQK